MMGPTHRLFGAVCGAGMAIAADADATMTMLTALVATATSHGWSSPDVDQTDGWRAATRLLPARARALTAHRRVTHWWGLPVLAYLLVLPTLPQAAHWPATALLCGWVSHLLGDAIFGTLPLLPWGGPTVGLGLDTGGFIETGRAEVFGRERLVLPFGPTRVLLALCLVWLLAGTPGTGHLTRLWDMTATPGASTTSPADEGGTHVRR